MSKHKILRGLNTRMNDMIHRVRSNIEPSVTLVSEDVKQKHKGTIGIIGFESQEVVQLKKSIIAYGHQIGLVKDQDFPRIISVGISTREIRLLENQVDLCQALGSDVIALATDTGHSNFIHTFKERFSIPIFSMNSECDINALSKKVLDNALDLTKPRRPDTKFHGNHSDMEKALHRDAIVCVKGIRRMEEVGGFPILQNPFVGIIGGKSFLSSASFSHSLVKENIPFVHLSINETPETKDLEEGKSNGHYKLAYNILHKLGAYRIADLSHVNHQTILDNVEEEYVIDIAKSITKTCDKKKEFILLGCDDFVKQYASDNPTCHIASSAQENLIKASIIAMKSGRVEEAKTTIMSVLDELRTQHGNDLDVVFANGELPLLFSDFEMITCDYIDPTKTMEKILKKDIIKETHDREDRQEEKRDKEDLKIFNKIISKPIAIKLVDKDKAPDCDETSRR